jgi:hypothetical protein
VQPGSGGANMASRRSWPGLVVHTTPKRPATAGVTGQSLCPFITHSSPSAAVWMVLPLTISCSDSAPPGARSGAANTGRTP